MGRNINCMHNRERHYCNNTNKKKSFFGFGERYCDPYMSGNSEKECPYRVEMIFPSSVTPFPPRPKKEVDISFKELFDQVQKQDERIKAIENFLMGGK